MAAVKTKIEFKRGHRADTFTSQRMVYPSRCGRFKLEKMTCRFDYRTRWYALHFMDEPGRVFWHMIVHMKTYRTRNAAIRAMEKYRKVLDGEPIIKRKTRKRSLFRKKVCQVARMVYTSYRKGNTMKDYDRIAKDSAKCKEKKDCAVRAVTAVSNLPYEYVRRAFARNGRISGRGTPFPVIWKTLKELNLWVEAKPKPAKTVRSLKKSLPKKGRYLVFVRGHMLAAVDGQIIDWTDGRLHRITEYYEVSF